MSKSHEMVRSRDMVDLLGVTLDNKLMFDHHINELCKKARGQLNALKRLGPFISKKSRLAMIHAFIFSHFNFCPLVWYFSSPKALSKIEKIHERSLLFVEDDYLS